MATKQIVSMLAGEKSVRLFTITGEMMDLKEDGPYDIGKIVEDLTLLLTGTAAVDFDIEIYNTKKDMVEQYADQGIIMTTTIGGKTVQGIFYPEKTSTPALQVGDEVIEMPKLENLQKHMNRAMKENSDGVKNFIKRISTIIKDRKHSVEDLMDFIKHSELPLTNDGRIIAYKRVNKGSGKNQYVDCHTGKVIQHLGTRVWMKADLVNPDRNQSCSNGLHVANLGYMQNFRGDFTLIVLVNPEDFIAVPHGEVTKARVCAYDIIGVLKNSTQEILDQGAHATDNIDLKKLVQQAIIGDHIQPWETLQIGRSGEMIKREVIPEVPPPYFDDSDEEKPKKTTPSKVPSGDSLRVDPEPETINKTPVKLQGDLPLEVKLVFDDLIAGLLSKAEIGRQHEVSTRTIGRWMEKYDFDNYSKSVQTSLTIPEKARQLYNQMVTAGTEEARQALREFKKAKKKSWSALGFSMSEEEEITKDN